MTKAAIEAGLEIVAHRKELLRALTAVIGVVQPKTTTPILSNLLLEAVTSDELRVTATNLDQFVQVNLPAKVRGQGSVTIPARKLYEYVRTLGGDEVRLLQKENNWVNIRCGRSSSNMVGMDAANFPKIPEAGSRLATVNAKDVRFMIQNALPTVCEEEARYSLNGGLLKLTASQLEMVTTDGHRLTRVTKTAEVEIASEQKLFIPEKALGELVKLIEDDTESLQIYDDGKTLFFRPGIGKMLASRKATGEFPNYKAVIPKPDAAKPVLLDAATMRETFARCLIFSDHQTRLTALSFAEGELRVKAAAADIGETEETLEILNGPKMLVGFNGDYLKELFSIAAGAVEVRIKDANSPALAIWRNDDGFTVEVVIMPMALNGKGK